MIHNVLIFLPFMKDVQIIFPDDECEFVLRILLLQCAQRIGSVVWAGEVKFKIRDNDSFTCSQ